MLSRIMPLLSNDHGQNLQRIRRPGRRLLARKSGTVKETNEGMTRRNMNLVLDTSHRLVSEGARPSAATHFIFFQAVPTNGE